LDWKKESEMFNNAAEYYDKYRPGYPSEIINSIIEKTDLRSGAKLLEIGSGSGKATELFINKGFEILCLDPGADLVNIGNKKFNGKNVKFETARFEEYMLPANHFDTIFSAQAFHWIPQPIGFQKCFHTLKINGYLALFWNMYIIYDNNMDNDLLKISNKYGGFADFLSKNECEERINSINFQLKNSGLFEEPMIIRSLWKKTYTADEYYGFTLTGNRFIQKSNDEKQAAYHDLTKLANQYNGYIERPYLCVLYLSRKNKS